MYIGQTRKTIQDRFKEHICSAFNPNDISYSTHLKRAIRKYGVNSFTVESIEQCDEDQLNDREKYWISYFDSMAHGYNMTLGGEGSSKYTDEEILAAWNAGNSLTMISESIGIKSVLAGVRLRALGITEEEINKRGYSYTANNLCRPVYQYGLDGSFLKEYPSLKVAENELQCTSIASAVEGYTKTSCGYQWRYYKADHIDPYHSNNFGVSKEVHQYGFDGQYLRSYESAASAARAVGQITSNLCSVCNGEQRSCGGFLWSYEKHDKIDPIRQKNTTAKPVAQYTLDGVFIASYPSATSACKATGTRLSSISSVCNGRFKSAGGYIWTYNIEDKEVA